MTNRLQRLASLIVAQLIDADVAEALVGDLTEERAARARVAGPTRAALWYWAQVIRSMGPLLHGALRRKELVLACVAGLVGYAFAVAAENAARDAVALVASHTAVDALPVLIVYLPTIVLAAYLAERVEEGAALALGLLVALAGVVQLVANAHHMPLWYRCVSPLAGPAAALAGRWLLIRWSRRAAGARRRRSIA
jgi:hypothetical protein